MAQRFQLLFVRYAFNPWSLAGLALLLRLAVFFLYYFVYKTPGGVPPSPLGNDPYDLLGRQLLNADISNPNFAYRPPLFPMFIAVTYAVSGSFDPRVVVLAQIALSASMCLLACRLAAELGLSPAAQMIAGLLTALDPASIAIAQKFMAETLANFFIALSLIFLARLLRRGRLPDAAACAGALALATLARPNPLYFVFIAILALIGRAPGWPAKAAAMAAVFLLGVGPWFVRNYVYHGSLTFATTGDFNLLFYKAVSVEYWATGRSPQDIEAEFAYEVERRLGIAEARETYDANAMWRHLVPADPRANRIMRQMAQEVYLAHPLVYLALLPITLVKLLAFTESYADFGWLRWVDLAFNVFLGGFAFMGGLLVFREKRRIGFVTLVAPIAYYLAVPALTGGVQDTRARTNVTICFAILCSLALSWLWRRWRDRKALAPAADDLPRP